jgi:DNA-binding response OmpR family regulator
MARILGVDDDPRVLETIEDRLSAEEHTARLLFGTLVIWRRAEGSSRGLSESYSITADSNELNK